MDVEQLLDKKMMEVRQLRAQLMETSTALALVVAHLGDSRGVIRIPAGARKGALRIGIIDLKWSNPERFHEVGSLRIVPELRKDI